MKTKNNVMTVATVLVIGFFIALFIFNMKDSNSADTESNSVAESSEAIAMHEQYPGLPEENRFVKETPDEIISRLSSGTGVIFLGFKECPWCQMTAPLVNQAAEDAGVSVYYLDIREARDNLTSDYQELVSILSPHLPNDENGTVRISTPDISFVKNGEIVWRHEMEATTEAERTPDTYWTEERQERAINQFREEMKKLK